MLSEPFPEPLPGMHRQLSLCKGICWLLRSTHAVQDKVWVDAPDVPLGAWEVYTVLADDPTNGGGTQSVCCSTTPNDGAGPCCAGPLAETVE